jgi:hypothetical protein
MNQIARLLYNNVSFDFECGSQDALRGKIVLDQSQRACLRELMEAEEEWYLDGSGERLPAEALFEKSPWSIEKRGETVKVLNRLLNPETGEAWFQMPEDYGGELFRWMRA